MKAIYLIFIVLFLTGAVYALDTNGIWHYSKDMRPGIFGSDEYAGTYQFNDNVKILNNLNITTNSGRALISSSTDNDAVMAVTSASGKSAIYGYADNSNAYSGFFEGGNFVVRTGRVGIGNINPSAKLDVSGDIKANNIYSNGNLVATQNWVNSNDNLGWFSGNDGSGSGLDADLLDGRHWSYIKSYVDNNDNIGANKKIYINGRVLTSGDDYTDKEEIKNYVQDCASLWGSLVVMHSDSDHSGRFLASCNLNREADGYWGLQCENGGGSGIELLTKNTGTDEIKSGSDWNHGVGSQLWMYCVY